MPVAVGVAFLLGRLIHHGGFSGIGYKPVRPCSSGIPRFTNNDCEHAHKCRTLSKVRFEFMPHAWQHSIESHEIRTVIEYPLLRYAITTRRFPDANTYMFVGSAADVGPWIEVAAEDEDGQTWVVFHAMMLTTKTAAAVYAYSEGAVDLRDQCTRQRRFIGPQYRKE
jgi:hypothetical protein